MSKEPLKDKIIELEKENLILKKSLEEAYHEIIETLKLALSVKDGYTHTHTERVAEYALIISSKINKDLILEVKYSALMLHDVGKLGISPDILKKPGKLTSQEYDEVKKHTFIGENIITPLKRLREALVVIKYHHERWDGNGYPYKLKGDQIPLAARVLSVADAFDAMTTDRPYRKALPLEVAKREIIDNKGTQFDPSVVDAFLKALDELAELYYKKST